MQWKHTIALSPCCLTGCDEYITLRNRVCQKTQVSDTASPAPYRNLAANPIQIQLLNHIRWCQNAYGMTLAVSTGYK